MARDGLRWLLRSALLVGVTAVESPLALGGDSEVLARVWERLDRARPGDEAMLARHLATTYQDQLDVLYAAWRGERGSAPARMASSAQSQRDHHEFTRQTLEEALRRCPADQGERFFAWLLSEVDGQPAELAALGLLGRVGSASCADLVLQQWQQADVARLHSAVAQNAFRQALTSLSQRHESVMDSLSLGLAQMDGGHEDLVVDVMARSGTEGLQRLLSHRRRSASLELRLLAALRDQQDAVHVQFADELADRVRQDLGHKDVRVRRLAAQLAVRFFEVDSVEPLIGLLDDKDQLLLRCAHQSLSTISGRGLAADAALWRAWWESEQVWWENVARPLLAESDPEPAQAMDLLRELTGHRALSQRTAVALTGWLDHPQAAVRAGTCAALGPLKVGSTAAALRHTTQDEDVAVQEAARRALDQISKG